MSVTIHVYGIATYIIYLYHWLRSEWRSICYKMVTKLFKIEYVNYEILTGHSNFGVDGLPYFCLLVIIVVIRLWRGASYHKISKVAQQTAVT